MTKRKQKNNDHRAIYFNLLQFIIAIRINFIHHYRHSAVYTHFIVYNISQKLAVYELAEKTKQKLLESVLFYRLPIDVNKCNGFFFDSHVYVRIKCQTIDNEY